MIGVDFDNTIVRYDDVFGRVALDLGLVPPHAATSKTAVRDHLRAIGQEDRWTELQGIIYGPRMMDAELFPGVAEFFARCREGCRPVAIVSIRRTPMRSVMSPTGIWMREAPMDRTEIKNPIWKDERWRSSLMKGARIPRLDMFMKATA